MLLTQEKWGFDRAFAYAIAHTVLHSNNFFTILNVLSILTSNVAMPGCGGKKIQKNKKTYLPLTDFAALLLENYKQHLTSYTQANKLLFKLLKYSVWGRILSLWGSWVPFEVILHDIFPAITMPSQPLITFTFATII